MSTPETHPTRRRILQGLASTFALPALSAAPAPKPASASPMNGMLCSPHSFYDEGIDFMLDVLEEKSATNSIIVYTYQGMTPGSRGATYLANHGKPLAPDRLDDATTWVNVDERYFRATPLRHKVDRPDQTYADKDICADLEQPLRERGMKLYARILEDWSLGYRPGFFSVHQIDLHGRIDPHACYNHPDHQEFWVASAHNLFAQYGHLAGIFWGSERQSPLSEALSGKTPCCFCEHCKKLAAELHVDAGRAAEGLGKLLDLSSRLRAKELPSDGVFVSIMRLFVEYPEILGWEKVWRTSYLAIPNLLRGLLKSLDPALTLGWHGDHAATGLDLFKRIGLDYGALTETFDWLKPSVYHLAAAPRLRGKFTGLHDTFLADLPKEEALDFYYFINGYDAAAEPDFSQLATAATEDGRLSENYVRHEVARAVKAVDGRAKIYAGPGIGIPGGPESKVESPELTYNDCVACFEGGADGLIIGREYDEIPFANLEAVGRAWREWVAAREE